MNIKHLLSRLDDEALQKLLGNRVVRLVMLLDPSMRSPTKLRELLVGMKSKAGLLIDKYDRDVLLEYLKPDEGLLLCKALGKNEAGNVYDELRSLNIRRGSINEVTLFNFFEMSPPPLKERIIPPTISDIDVSYGLFDYQRTAARKLQTLLNQPRRRAILHMPTGSGKTRTMMHVIARHLTHHEPTLVVWLAYSEELCEQAAEEFIKAWGFLGNRQLQIARFWGPHQVAFDELQDGLLIAGLSKMYQSVARGIQTIGAIGTRASLVVLDEAHMAVAETYELILDALVIPFEGTALAGLTATPGRTWADIDEDERLARFFDRKKVTLEVEGYENPVRFLVDQGYLAKAEFRSLFYESGLELEPQDFEKIKSSIEIPDNMLVALAEDEVRNLRIVLEIEELAKRHQRIIVFATTVEHARLLSSILRARGLNASNVTGDSSSFERLRAIQSFKEESDDVRILCNYGVLTTGFDAPKTSAAIIARPTKSLVLYSQMVGRAMRGVRAGGNESSEIVTVVDRDLPGFHDFADAFYNWEDIWED